MIRRPFGCRPHAGLLDQLAVLSLRLGNGEAEPDEIAARMKEIFEAGAGVGKCPSGLLAALRPAPFQQPCVSDSHTFQAATRQTVVVQESLEARVGR